MNPDSSDDFFATARREWPPVFGVAALRELAPGIIAPGSVHNAISLGIGPPNRKVNSRVILERDSFLSWLLNRPRVSKRGGKNAGE
ncbi:hypothetical protein [Solidesulfovibrio magneticus]|uniref:hypothetical protein n=1 Tax=Solidesulfovibrio magneticus TaxID=184917 RepID=UPI0005BBF71B|nr:hypothetical protein [Solidesulfovibrio magneticus]